MNGSVSPLNNGGGASPLPDVLLDLTERVVRGTWLWPSEKRDVRAELQSHFREGLADLMEVGLSPEESVAQLREGFGDPKLAAKLIRRGKKRGRTMLHKLAVSTALVVLSAAGAGTGYVAYINLAKPNPTVDYVAKINEANQGIPQQDRAWPLLQDVAIEMQPHLQKLADLTAKLPAPGDTNWKDALEQVVAMRPVLPRLIEASRKPAYGAIYGQKEALEFMRRRAIATQAEWKEPEKDDPLFPPTIALLLPNLADQRSMAKFLLLNARDDMTRNNFSGAWQSIDAAYRLGVLHFSGQTLIEQLVGRAITALAETEMQRTLYAMRDRITSKDLATVRASSIFTTPAAALAMHPDGEQIMFQDVIQYVFTDDGHGNGRLIPSQYKKIMGLIAPEGTPEQAPSDPVSTLAADSRLMAMAGAHADRRDTVKKYEEWTKQSSELRALPLYDPHRSDADNIIMEAKGEPGSAERYHLVFDLVPALSRADMMVREANMAREATQAVVAMLQYRVDHGALPKQLNDLVPQYAKQAPIDIYSGAPLRYTHNADAVRLYSIGRNLVDDGGSSSNDRAHDGAPADIVYWPAE